MIRHTPWAAPPYDFAIGLRTIAPEDWLEGGDAEAGRKTALLAEAPQNVWGETEGSRPGQAEVRSLVEAATGARADPALPPMWAASLLCADDLCLMERRDGRWVLSAVSLCSPTFFTVAESLGKSLDELHGPVPGFEDRFLPRVARMFDALAAGPILERSNWTVTASGEAYLPSSAPVRAKVPDIPPGEAGSRVFLRVERQTLQKLPDTEGVLFTIRAWRNPLNDLKSEPDRLAAFAAAWRGASDDFRAYKGLAAYDTLVAAFLAP